MRRNVDLNEISDGKLYTSNDMVKADCYECQGCSACCRGMGKSIILDPIDLFHLKQATGKDFCRASESGDRVKCSRWYDPSNLKWILRRMPVRFWMRTKDVGFMRFGRESADCFRWEGCMKKRDFDIFF